MSGANISYCHNCMKQMEVGTGVCPYCGHDNEQRHNPSDTLRDGTILNGKYLVGSILGRGGFGITYFGYDLNLQMKVAIKEYFPSGVGMRSHNSNEVSPSTGLSTPKDFEKGCTEFQTEARTLAQFIGSPNIVSVRDYFRENGTAYIIMEFVEGNTLTKEVEKYGGQMPWQRVPDLFKPLMLELEKLHKRHLIHRDIKPDNLKVVTDEDGTERLVLLDFGNARTFVSAEITKTLTANVTPGYAPLEQYSTNNRQGPFTDVYGLCATMYALMSGSLPPEATERVIKDEIKPLRDFNAEIPANVENALMHGLAVRSEDRTQTMRELYDELEKPDPPKPPKPPEPPKPPFEDPQSTVDTKEWSYKKARKLMNEGTEEGLKKAAEHFAEASGWRDADKLAAACRNWAEELRRQRIYEEADQSMLSGTKSGYKTALRLYSQIRGYKDADRKAAQCLKKINPGTGLWIVLAVVLLAAACAGYFLLRPKGTAELDGAAQTQTVLALMQTDIVRTQEAFADGQTKTVAAAKAAAEQEATQKVIAQTQTKLAEDNSALQATQTKAAEPTPTPTNTPRTFTALKTGEIFSFGSYEQDNNLNNGMEPIEWQVLDVQDDRALVISKYGLDAKPYNEQNKSVTWETSTLRKWLNGEFYENAFSSSEQRTIREVTNENPDNADYGTRGGNRTQDRVFLLSIDEVNKYFPSDDARKCRATDFAKENGAQVSDRYGGTSVWWLRSPGSSGSHASDVNFNGWVFSKRDNVHDNYVVVRPAFWLNLSEDSGENIIAELIIIPTDTPTVSVP